MLGHRDVNGFLSALLPKGPDPENLGMTHLFFLYPIDNPVRSNQVQS